MAASMQGRQAFVTAGPALNQIVTGTAIDDPMINRHDGGPGG
jgi:hypothetical protein